jgi:WD40 repeat protein
MLRWLSFFGAVALVVIGVVFYIQGGPPATLIEPPDEGVVKQPAQAAGRQALGNEQKGGAADGQQSGPWTRDVAITPRVVMPGGQLSALYTPQVPSMRDGQLLFLGTELKLQPGEERPKHAFEQEVPTLVTEVAADEKGPQDDWFQTGDKWYRPLKKGEDPRANKLKLEMRKRWFVEVDAGTRVKEGDLLAVIDPALAVADLRIKLAKLDAADADRIAAVKTRDEAFERWQRADYLYQKGAGSLEDATAAKLAYEHYRYDAVSKAEGVKVAAQEARQALTIVDLHIIRSKINGQVKEVIKHPGEAVKNLETVLEMQDRTRMRIRTRVNLQDLSSLPNPHDPKEKRLVSVEATRRMAPRRVLSGHMDAVNGVAVSRDDQIVSVSEDRTARIWDAKEQKEQRVLQHPAAVRAVACTPKTAENVNLCLTGAADGVARLYDLSAKNGDVLREFRGGHKEGINAVAFSPDGRWIVTGGDDRAICLWDVEKGDEPLQRFPAEWGHKGGVTSLAFLVIGRDKRMSVASAGRGDNALIVWPLKADGAPEKPIRLDRRGGEVATLGASPDGSQVLFDQGKDLRVLSSENASLVGSMSATGGSSFTKMALFSPDGQLVLASTGPGHVQLWRAPTSKARGHELAHLGWVSGREDQTITNCGAFSPNSSFVVTGTQNRNVVVWPMPDKEDIERRLFARVVVLDPEVTSGQVLVTAELENPPSYLLPGDTVTMVVYPE